MSKPWISVMWQELGAASPEGPTSQGEFTGPWGEGGRE